MEVKKLDIEFGIVFLRARHFSPEEAQAMTIQETHPGPSRNLQSIQGRRRSIAPVILGLVFIVSCSLITGVRSSPALKAVSVKTTAIHPSDTVANTLAPVGTNVVDERASVAGMMPEEIREFFHRIKDNVANDKRTELAAMVDYPITVYIGAAQEEIADADQFAANYDQIITPKVRDAVLNQREEDLSINYRGVMIGAGEIWFAAVCSDNVCNEYAVYIIAINNYQEGS
jgi:hypothetical protein